MLTKVSSRFPPYATKEDYLYPLTASCHCLAKNWKDAVALVGTVVRGCSPKKEVGGREKEWVDGRTTFLSKQNSDDLSFKVIVHK